VRHLHATSAGRDIGASSARASRRASGCPNSGASRGPADHHGGSAHDCPSGTYRRGRGSCQRQRHAQRRRLAEPYQPVAEFRR
jgi:hypothetical protein